MIIVPCDRGSFDDLPHYTYSPGMDEDGMFVWQIVDKELRVAGYEVRLSDLSEFDNQEKAHRLLKKVDKIIFNNIPTWTADNWEEKLSWIGPDKCLLISWEPPSVLPQMYTSKTLDLFKTHLTWNDSYVDNRRFLKMNYPCIQGMIGNLPSFSEKKFAAQVSCNKQSGHQHELYSERKKVIMYFEEHPEFGFEFYGHGWPNTQFKNYRGAPADKIDVIKNFRFNFCYENMTHIKGYITEKIFDSFAAGCVPIYWGATNIHKYIPKNCYIAREDFSTMQQLVDYLNNMSEEKYNRYIANIQLFLKSPKANAFSRKRLATAIVKQVL